MKKDKEICECWEQDRRWCDPECDCVCHKSPTVESWKKRFRKLWKQDGLLCEARHTETYGGGKVFEQCLLCRDFYESFISQEISSQIDRLIERVEEIKEKSYEGQSLSTVVLIEMKNKIINDILSILKAERK